MFVFLLSVSRQHHLPGVTDCLVQFIVTWLFHFPCNFFNPPPPWKSEARMTVVTYYVQALDLFIVHKQFPAAVLFHVNWIP